MDVTFLLEQHKSADMAEGVSLRSLLERGLNYLQRGCYAEGAAVLALVREHMSLELIHLSDTFDTFLNGYAAYQRLQQAFQEASTRFAEAYAEQQTLVATFTTALPGLIRGIDVASDFSSTFQHGDKSPVPIMHGLSPQDCGNFPSLLMPPSTEDNTYFAGLSITCFGRFEVKRLGKPVVLCSNRKGQVILRYLVSKAGHSATSDTLQDMLWPDDEPEAARHKLYIAISALRRSLREGIRNELGSNYILYKQQVYSLNPVVKIRTDVDEFLYYYQIGQKKSQERVTCYEKACSLYTGPFLPEDMYTDWSFLQREQLNQIDFAMCRTLTEHYLKARCYEDAAKWSTAILKENPCDETAHRHLIQIYTAQGYRAEALQHYHRCERILREELGVQPLSETVQAFQAILTNEPSSNGQ